MSKPANSPDNPLRAVIGRMGPVVTVLIVASVFINVLALTGSLYMLQVYDRVLSSQSVPTLVVLTLLAGGLFAFQGLLEMLRNQIFVRVGSTVNRRLGPTVLDAALRLPLTGVSHRDALQPMRDLEAIRNFLSGPGPMAMLDMPWLPIYLTFIFILHPLLGWVTIAGAVVLLALTVTTQFVVRRRTATAAQSGKARSELADAAARNAEVARAMAMGPHLARRFTDLNLTHLADNERMSDVVGGLSTLSRTLRIALQSGILGLGAYLTIKGEMSAGAIIACTIAASRALAPIEIAIAHWRSMLAARDAKGRLSQVMTRLGQPRDRLLLPPPRRSVVVDHIAVAAPSKPRLVLADASFAAEAGQVLAIIGPSGAGKSSIARALTGVWPLARGSILIDDAALDRWEPTALGRHIGYLPQDVELFDGTVAENIGRLDPEATEADVLEAAQAAGVHKLALALPDGYETQIGEGGANLSAGQKQRIALARALFGRPFLVVLDEPNANLDAEGEEAVVAALHGIKQRGGIAVVVAHRPSVLAAADLVAVVNNGQVVAFGPRDDVLRRTLKRPAVPGNMGPRPDAPQGPPSPHRKPAEPASAGPVDPVLPSEPDPERPIR